MNNIRYIPKKTLNKLLNKYINELFNLRIVRERFKLAVDIQAGAITTDVTLIARFKEINTISDENLKGIAKFYGGVPRKGYLD